MKPASSRNRPCPQSAPTLRRLTPRASVRLPAPTRAPTRTRTTRTRTTRTRASTATPSATPATATRHRDAFVVAVIDNTVRDVGLCAYNLHGFDVHLRQFSDSNTYATLITVLYVFDPVEILLSLSSAGGLLDHTLQASPHLANVKRTFIGRTYFNDTYGALVTDNLSREPCPNLARLGESSCYLALACCGALIRYVEQIQHLAFAPSSLRIRFHVNHRSVFLDISTLEALEVVSNARAAHGLYGHGSSACLLRVMDRTNTRSGKRFLRRSLLEPCADMATISMRQQVVEELANSEHKYFAVVSILSKFPDLERVMASLMARENARLRAAGVTNPRQHDESTSPETSEDSDEQHMIAPHASIAASRLDASPPSMTLIQNILIIKASLQAIPPLLDAIQDSQATLLRAIAESMRTTALLSLQQEISDVIDADAISAKNLERMRMNGAFAVKSGRNGRLDTSRKILSENIEDMQTLTDEIRKKYGLYKLELALQAKRGYHFCIARRFLDIKDFPDEFIQIDEGKKIHRFSTEELGQLNLRYQDSLQQVWKWTEVELGALLNEIFRPARLTAIHRLCDSTAILDCLSTFVTYSSLCQTQTSRPKLTADGPIALQQAYHPVLFQNRPHTTIPNDVFLDETSALHIISGRNQAGKSTFIRKVGLICIMAHTGCNVPAKYASIRILRRVVTAFNTRDEILHSQSHFSREMHDVSTIFGTIQENGSPAAKKRDSRGADISSSEDSRHPNVLVLIDELGRSTSTLDGFSVAYAVVENLAKSRNVLTLFTTHFLGLGAMATVNPTIKNFHLSTAKQEANADGSTTDPKGENSINFDYKITDGVLTEAKYGIETAKLAGFPEEVVADAMELRGQIPLRRITLAKDFAESHFGLSAEEKLQIRKTESAVSIAQRLNLINVSSPGPEERQRLYRSLRLKIKNPHTRKSDDRAETAEARSVRD